MSNRKRLRSNNSNHNELPRHKRQKLNNNTNNNTNNKNGDESDQEAEKETEKEEFKFYMNLIQQNAFEKRKDGFKILENFDLILQ